MKKKCILSFLIVSFLILLPDRVLAGSGAIHNSGTGQIASWSSTSISVSVNLVNPRGSISGGFSIPGMTSEVNIYANSSWRAPASNCPYQLASNLTPNHNYQIYTSFLIWALNSADDEKVRDIYRTVITDCVPTPAPVYTNIKYDRVSIVIDRGTNSLAYPIVYKVYQGTSSSGPWTLVHQGTSAAQSYTFTKTGLVENTTYYYYVQAAGGSGIAAASPISSVMTSSDPTLAAVEAAKGAAETASREVTSMKNTVSTMQLDITDIRAIVNEIRMKDEKAPEIIDAYFSQRKSITALNTETVYISASDDKTPGEELQVRAIVNNTGGAWETFDGSINVNLNVSLNTVIIQVMDGSGKITSSKPLIIWKL